ncbi:S8 family peptidase [Phenylobacterium sp.]|jgi:subtilisin family serine protease|uniref:S8 family peptidase n=1 Tax=Phenylobacterium sp. TaxID=1871053 RepID=UPI0037CCB55B
MSEENDEPTGLESPELEGDDGRAAELTGGGPVTESAAAESAPRDVIVEIVLASGDPREATERAAAERAESFPEVARRFGMLEAKSPFPLPAGGLEAATEQQLEQQRYVRLKFPPGTSAEEVKAALKETPEVQDAVIVPRPRPPFPEPVKEPMVGASDQVVVGPGGFENQWYLHRTRVPAAWALTRGAGVVLADCDWGFRVTHHELRKGITKTRNVVDGSANVAWGDAADHGTAVLGIAGARANGAGMAGYAPEAELWAIKCDGPSDFDDYWIAGLLYVQQTSSAGRPKVVIYEVESENHGNYEQVPSVAQAIRDTIAAGCIVCVAAGNGNQRADRSDSGEAFAATGSILVGATAYHTTDNPRADFSNYGPSVDICAPGDPLHDLTLGHSGDAKFRNGFGGTSGATPKVAGAVALMLSVNPTLTHSQVRQILKSTGQPVQTDANKPIGVFLDVGAAVAEARRLAN